LADRDMSSEEPSGRVATDQTQRLDKWLWYARVAKTRSLAAALVERGRIRVNRVRTQKPSHTIKPGDVITASVHRDVRILKVLQAGTRRGPATEAQGLYEDLTPANELRSTAAQRGASESAVTTGASQTSMDPPTGRPSKKERRQLLRLKGQGNR
jgi:ribosome-associated heat shock protein Hsp15